MEAREIDRIVEAFPFLRELDADALDLLTRTSSIAELPAGYTIARPGDSCERIAFVLAGEARAHKTSPAGRDLTLYRIYPGQTCVLTALSMLADQAFPAQVDLTMDTTALVVGRASFRQLFDEQEPWRRLVFATMSDRLGDLLALIDSVLFTDLPARLADALITHQEAGVVRMTHEQIAGEVGSSREVVSRVLKSWERQGTVTLQRGQVGVVAPERLLLLLSGATIGDLVTKRR